MSHQITHRIGSRVGLVLAVAAPAAYGDGPIVQSPDSVERNAVVKAQPAVQPPDSVDRNATAGSGQVIDKVTPDARDAADPRPVVQVQPVLERVSSADGMDWGDAAIGAGATLGVILLASGGVLTISRHRGHAHVA